MVENNELIALILATGILVFFVAFRRGIRRIPHFRWLMDAYYCMYAGLLLTVAEGFFWGGAFNVLEHVLNALSSVLLVVWIWLVSRRPGEEA